MDITFESTGNAAGIVGETETWGGSWGDLNGDEYPDLFVSNHREQPKLYQNNGDGTFTDVTAAADISGTWISERHSDTHGGSWSDFDGDGDQDLYVTAGAADRNQFFVNQGDGTLVDMTSTFGPMIPSWRARMPVWFDYTNDGFLDFLMASENFVNLYQQDGGGFRDQTNAANVNCERSQAIFLADIAGTDRLEIICTDGRFPRQAYDAETIPFRNVTSVLPNVGFSQDTAIADFNGDLVQDFYHVRAQKRVTQTAQTGPNSLEAHMVVPGNGDKGFEFAANGRVSFELVEWEAQAFRVDPNALIFIGAAGNNPAGTRFTLDSNNPGNHGIAPHGDNVNGIYIGYLPAQGKWRVDFETTAWSQFSFEATSNGPMSAVTNFGLTQEDLPFTPALQISNNNQWTNRTSAWNINQAVSCISTVAGDFDNDMDQDLYVVCRGGVENLSNRLYENINNQRFQLVTNAGGAGGVVGFNVGTSESVVKADYDLDGFLDLFVTNGLALVPEGPGGPYELFRNRGNNNHWLLLDLVGVQSNRDGVGAKVIVTAGGTQQLREQNGGYHRWSQDHQRLHVGLGTNTTFDIRIQWPNGSVDSYSGLSADRLYEATEGSRIVAVGDDQPLNACGEPNIDFRADNSAFLYQDCTFNGNGDRWVFAVSGGQVPFRAYNGSIASNVPLVATALPASTGQTLENQDTLDSVSGDNEIDFNLFVGAGVDAFEFVLPANSSACVDLRTLPQTMPVRIGGQGTPFSRSFSIPSFTPCTQGLSVADLVVDEGTGIATVTISAALPAATPIQVNVRTVAGSANAGADYVNFSDIATIRVGDISTTVQVEIRDDAITESTETLQVVLSNPIGAALDRNSGTITIVDNDGIATCGEPTIDPSSEHALFIWQDCDGTNQSTWKVTASGGSAPWQGFDGVFTGSTALTATPFAQATGQALETSDVLDSTPANSVVDFELNVGGIGLDSFTLELNSNSDLCLVLSSIPGGARTLLGPDKHEFTGPLRLAGNGSCQ